MSGQYFFTMHAGPTPGKTFDLQGTSATIGREANNEVVINDPEISRKHSRLTFQGGTWIIEDLGSTNGTFVNETRLTGPYSLRLGDVVGLGEKIKLIFETNAADMNATMVAAPPPTPAAAPIPSQPAPSNPVYYTPPTPPPPSPSYAGQVPSSPQYAEPQPATPAKNNRTILIVVVLVILLCLICCCVGVFWYIDSNALYCDYVPFLFGSACP